MLIESAKDIFWLVLAFAVLWLTLFFSWMLYYIIRMLRQMSSMTDKVSETVNMIHSMVKSIKDKSENVATYIAALIKSGDQLKKFIQKKDQTGGKRHKKGK